MKAVSSLRDGDESRRDSTISKRDLADCKRNLKLAYTIVQELHGFFHRQSNDEMVKYLDNTLEAVLEVVNHLPDPREKV
jgi:hypothetical protein